MTSQPVQGCEDSLNNGPAPRHLPVVGEGSVPLLGLEIQGVIDGKSQGPALLMRRKTLFLDGTGLAMLLTSHVLIAGVATMLGSPFQDLPLGTDRMVSPVFEASSGDQVGFMYLMVGNIGGDALAFQKIS